MMASASPSGAVPPSSVFWKMQSLKSTCDASTDDGLMVVPRDIGIVVVLVRPRTTGVLERAVLEPAVVRVDEHDLLPLRRVAEWVNRIGLSVVPSARSRPDTSSRPPFFEGPTCPARPSAPYPAARSPYRSRMHAPDQTVLASTIPAG